MDVALLHGYLVWCLWSLCSGASKNAACKRTRSTQAGSTAAGCAGHARYACMIPYECMAHIPTNYGLSQHVCSRWFYLGWCRLILPAVCMTPAWPAMPAFSHRNCGHHVANLCVLLSHYVFIMLSSSVCHLSKVSAAMHADPWAGIIPSTPSLTQVHTMLSSSGRLTRKVM